MSVALFLNLPDISEGMDKKEWAEEDKKRFLPCLKGQQKYRGTWWFNILVFVL